MPTRSRIGEAGLKRKVIRCGFSTSTLSTKPSTTRRYSLMPCVAKRLKLKATSSAVIGVPSEKVTSSRRLKVTKDRSSGYSSVVHMKQYMPKGSSAVLARMDSLPIVFRAAGTPSVAYWLKLSKLPCAQIEISPPLGASGLT